MEDDIKILKMEYLSNYWSDISQISNLSLGDRIKIFNGRWPWNIMYRMLLRGKSEENLEVISSVALLSPACLHLFSYKKNKGNYVIGIFFSISYLFTTFTPPFCKSQNPPNVCKKSNPKLNCNNCTYFIYWIETLSKPN